MAFVNEPENELIVHGSDRSGARATLQTWIESTEVDPEAGAAAAIGAGVQGVSNDAITSVEILRHATQTSAVTPTAGPYQRPSDKAIMVFQGSDGSPAVMQIPAPQETILDSGAINVDPTDTAAAAFIAYVIANCLTAEGAPITSFVRGYRRRPPRLKKQ